MLLRCSEKKDITEWNQWREDNPDEDIFLEGANLEKLGLNGINFEDAYLKGAGLDSAYLEDAALGMAHLENANLSHACLRRAELLGTYLNEAVLIYCCLEDSEIANANFKRAVLFWALLEGASLKKVNFEGAILDGAIVDSSTLIWNCEVDRDTDFRSVALNNANIDPATKQLLEYNIRRMNWEDWYKEYWFWRWPVRLPVLNWIMNRLLAKMPVFNWFCLTWIIVARLCPEVGREKKGRDEPTVSVIIPTRNEKGNMEDAFTRTPKMGKWTELVFVDGNSDDGTVEEIERCIEKYGRQWHQVTLLGQSGKGKGQAVRQGFAECQGDILMILDSDLTMPPEELPKYYEAIVSGKGEFINGCRLVYPMEKKAMRFLNMIANYFFACLFTWLLGQRVKDTLCGTKVLWRRDYERIAANRSYFGDFDPFGDFDLLFGASRLNHKIIDMPIRYRERSYGEIKISRWQHGWLLLRMSLVAFRKLKLS